MKKIMFFIPTMGGGGAERVISILSEDFVSRGLDVIIVVYKNVEKSYKLAKGVNLISLENLNDSKSLSLFRRVKLIRRVVKEYTPDYVISFLTSVNINVCVATLGLPCEVIVSERNDPKQLKGFINILKRNIAYSFADKFVFQTTEAMKCFPINIQRRSKVILNPISTQFPVREKNEKRIVAVGRLNYQKNYPLLLESFVPIVRKYPEYVLEIYGSGELEYELKDICDSLSINDNVRFMGFQKDVYECIKDASAFVMSSDFEGLPNALLEAMCMGLPCISTDCPCGGPNEVINNEENGLLVPVGDVDKMTKALLRYIESPTFANKCGNKAKELARRLELKEISNQWLEFLDIRN